MYKVILTPRLGQGQRVSVTHRFLGAAMSFAKTAAKGPDFERVTVFDNLGKIVAETPGPLPPSARAHPQIV